MKYVIEKLRGNKTLSQALSERIDNIKKIGDRKPFKFKVIKEGGHTQVFLHPRNDSEKDFS